MAAVMHNYVPPTCEDYDSVSSTFHITAARPSPAAANVSTKRSHPSDLDKEKPPAKRDPVNIDLRSDSGYSSFTTATVSSADSAPSATTQRSPPQAPASTASNTAAPPQSPAHKPRRPTLSNANSNTSTGSRPSRTASQRRPTLNRRLTITQDHPNEDECDNPNCANCGPNAGPSRRRSEQTPPTPRDTPSYYGSPTSPSFSRRPSYSQGTTIVRPEHRRTSSTARPRPISYAGESNSPYWHPGMSNPYPTPPQDHGPPPSASAYHRNMPQYHPMTPMAPYIVPNSQSNGYYSQYPNVVASPTTYDMPPPQRPAMPNRNSTGFGTRNQPPPIVTQQDRPDKSKYSARYSQPQSGTSTTFPQQIRNQAYDTSDSSESSEGEIKVRRADREPQPNLKRSQSKKRRPTLTHANTTPVTDLRERRKSIVTPRLEAPPEVLERRERAERREREARRGSIVEGRQSVVIPDHSKHEKRSSRAIDAPMRRPSTSRPPPPKRETQSAYETPKAQVVVNQTRPKRPQSVQMYKMYEQYAIEDRYRNNTLALEQQKAERAIEEAKALKAEAKALKEAKARAREAELLTEQRRKNRRSQIVYNPSPIFDESESESECESCSEEEEEERSLPLRSSRRPATRAEFRPATRAEGRPSTRAEVRAEARPATRAEVRPLTRAEGREGRKGKERIVETNTKAMAAEDYISAQRGSQIPYVDLVHRDAKRGSRIPSEPHDSGSSHSGGSGKQSLSAQTVATSNGNEIRLRVDASAPLSLAFNGDMEGRTLQLIPAENGMADIVIGNARDEESTYHAGDRGSVLGFNRRSLIANQARRDAEEMTERSSRSERSSVRSRREGRDRESRDMRDPREGQRHVLRRHHDYRE